MRDRLRHWLKQASPTLAQASNSLPPDLPSTLSFGQNKCVEPLIHIADVAGGSWPARVRAALVALFDLAEASPELEMLFDIRAIFRNKNNPDFLSTSDLLSALRALDHRPWSAWSSKSGRRLAGHLRPFGISSRRFCVNSNDDFMGYLREDFHDSWERHLSQSSADDRLAISVRDEQNQPATPLPPAGTIAHAETGISALGAD